MQVPMEQSGVEVRLLPSGDDGEVRCSIVPLEPSTAEDGASSSGSAESAARVMGPPLFLATTASSATTPAASADPMTGEELTMSYSLPRLVDLAVESPEHAVSQRVASRRLESARRRESERRGVIKKLDRDFATRYNLPLFMMPVTLLEREMSTDRLRAERELQARRFKEHGIVEALPTGRGLIQSGSVASTRLRLLQQTAQTGAPQG